MNNDTIICDLITGQTINPTNSNKLIVLNLTNDIICYPINNNTISIPNIIFSNSIKIHQQALITNIIISFKLYYNGSVTSLSYNYYDFLYLAVCYCLNKYTNAKWSYYIGSLCSKTYYFSYIINNKTYIFYTNDNIKFTYINYNYANIFINIINVIMNNILNNSKLIIYKLNNIFNVDNNITDNDTIMSICPYYIIVKSACNIYYNRYDCTFNANIYLDIIYNILYLYGSTNLPGNNLIYDLSTTFKTASNILITYDYIQYLFNVMINFDPTKQKISDNIINNNYNIYIYSTFRTEINNLSNIYFLSADLKYYLYPDNDIYLSCRFPIINLQELTQPTLTYSKKKSNRISKIIKFYKKVQNPENVINTVIKNAPIVFNNINNYVHSRSGQNMLLSISTGIYACGDAIAADLLAGVLFALEGPAGSFQSIVLWAIMDIGGIIGGIAALGSINAINVWGMYEKYSNNWNYMPFDLSPPEQHKSLQVELDLTLCNIVIDILIVAFAVETAAVGGVPAIVLKDDVVYERTISIILIKKGILKEGTKLTKIYRFLFDITERLLVKATSRGKISLCALIVRLLCSCAKITLSLVVSISEELRQYGITHSILL